jgi:hypothetical protein
MSVRLYNADDNQFQVVDGGEQAQYNLLLNILIELRVQTLLMLSNGAITTDDPAQLRLDVVNDGVTMQTTSVVSTFTPSPI